MAARATKSSPQPVALFLGDPVLTDPAAREHICALLPAERREADLEIVRLPDRKLLDVLDSIQQVGLFGVGRCIWIRGLGAETAEEAAELHAVLAADGVPDGYSLVATSSKLDMRGRLAKWLRDAGRFVDLRVTTDRKGNVDEQSVRRLVTERLAAAGVPAPDAAALRAIALRAGGDAGQLASEIDKLALLCGSGRPPTADDVGRHMRDLGQAWVFDLTGAIGRRRLAEAHSLLERLLAAGEAPLGVLGALANNVAGLIAARAILPSLPPAALRHGQTFVKSYFAALPERERASFGNNAWRAWFALEAARAFEPAELRRLHAALADIDIRMKSSRLEPADLLFSFLLEACAAPGRGNAQLS